MVVEGAIATVELALAVVVQSLMLFQVSLSYAILHFKHSRRPADYELPGVEEVSANSTVSVVIPAYRERSTILATLQRLASEAERPDLVEVIVVDAGGGDGTMEIAAWAAESLVGGTTKAPLQAVRCDVKSVGGRGPAVAAGARAASGAILVVVHADTTVPPGYDARLRSALAEPTTLATAFRFAVDYRREDEKTMAQKLRGLAFSVMERTVAVRSKVLQLPFGDQAIALTRRRFLALGGASEPLCSVPILEDYILVQRLRRLGVNGKGRIQILGGPPAYCNARRWLKSSVWRVNFVNQCVMLLYNYANYTPHQIFRLYYGTKVTT